MTTREAPPSAGDVVRLFLEKFPEHSANEVGVACAPGRANLIGEHTDYQEGLVTPFALEGMVCHVAYAPRGDSLLKCHALDLSDYGECDLAEVARARRADASFGGRKGDFDDAPWLRYVAGAFEFMHSTALGLTETPTGCDLLVTSTVPRGAGVSSSSALVVASVVAARDSYRSASLHMSLLDACCRAEWHFSGVRGGIMDQFASLHGVDGAAIVLDCRSRRVSRQVDLSGVEALVLNTNVKHDLRDSPYAKRREACERVARAAGVAFLRDLSDRGDAVAVLDRLLHSGAISDEDHARATHGCLENIRVLQAADLADRRDWTGLGRVLDEAHASLRDLYQVSCPELDAAQQAATQAPGCFGARMMGGGFGGCVLALCAPACASRVAARVLETYPANFQALSVFQAAPGPGATLQPPGTSHALKVTDITRLWV